MNDTKLKASIRESCLQTTCSCPWLLRKGGAGTGTSQDSQESRPSFESRLAYHLRCLQEDAIDPWMTAPERPALVRDRLRQIREILEEFESSLPNVMTVASRNRTPQLVRVNPERLSEK